MMPAPPSGFGGGSGASGAAARDHMAGRLFYWLENIIIFVVLFQFSTALVALLLTDPMDLDSVSPLARNLWYPGYVLVLLLALRTLPSLLRTAVFNPILILCVLWCGISFFGRLNPM